MKEDWERSSVQALKMIKRYELMLDLVFQISREQSFGRTDSSFQVRLWKLEQMLSRAIKTERTLCASPDSKLSADLTQARRYNR